MHDGQQEGEVQLVGLVNEGQSELEFPEDRGHPAPAARDLEKAIDRHNEYADSAEQRFPGLLHEAAILEGQGQHLLALALPLLAVGLGEVEVPLHRLQLRPQDFEAILNVFRPGVQRAQQRGVEVALVVGRPLAGRAAHARGLERVREHAADQVQ